MHEPLISEEELMERSKKKKILLMAGGGGAGCVLLLYCLVIVGLLGAAVIGGGVYFIYTEAQYDKITIGDETRQYILYVPDEITEASARRQADADEEEVPLLICNHGGGGNARAFRKKSQFQKVAQNHNFVVAYPEGKCSFFHTSCSWDSGSISSDGQDDVEFLDTLVGELVDNPPWKNQHRFRINASHVYMMGHSNGAMMTYTYASKGSRQLNSIAPVSGSIGGKNAKTNEWYNPPDVSSMKTNVFHVHGVQDDNVKIQGGEANGYGHQYRHRYRYDYGMNESLSYWLKQDECLSQTVANASIAREYDIGDELCLSDYSSGCENQLRVRSMVLKHGTHEWKEMNQYIEDSSSSQKSSFAHGSSSLAELIWNSMKSDEIA